MHFNVQNAILYNIKGPIFTVGTDQSSSISSAYNNHSLKKQICEKYNKVLFYWRYASK